MLLAVSVEVSDDCGFLFLEEDDSGFDFTSVSGLISITVAFWGTGCGFGFTVAFFLGTILLTFSTFTPTVFCKKKNNQEC